MFLWILIVGILFAFYNSWGIGANDCANSFATSVGSKVLTIKQALIIASIFEFLGAFLMGSHVADAIRKKIVNSSMYTDDPGALMYGMLCAELSSAIWLTVATYFKWPVSTTHSIIGSIIGFSMAYGGVKAVLWKKVGFVVLSWFLSPILAGLFSSSFFILINKFIFKSSEPFKNTEKLFPLITFFTFFINTLFIIYKGSPQLELDELPIWIVLLVSFLIGTITSILSKVLYLPYAKNKINKKLEELEENKNNNEGELNTRTESYSNAINESCTDTVEDNNLSVVYDSSKSIDENIKNNKNMLEKLQNIKLENKIRNLHENAEHIDEKSEELCNWLQIITACFSSFAHGSNDVANSVAPLATIYHIYKYHNIEKKTEVPLWVLFLGGIGIVFGLATWGYKIINRLGKELTKISTSRGFIIELGAALTVIIASRAEMPVSTTHCQVGSIVGCGLVGGMKNIDLKLLRGVVFSWLLTLLFTGILSAGLFSYGFYSP